VYNKQDLLTVLALERTILAKQRTILSEISVLLGTVGLGLLLFRFYDQFFVKVVGSLVALVALAVIIHLYTVYTKFKKKVDGMDERNHILD
jgi:uncharacterized membrane protein YidH (DUF202 family)